MANIQLTHAPILNSSAQILILPVNTAGILLDPVLARTKTLFSDNYQSYYQACRDGNLNVGSCLLLKRTLEQTGLGASSSGNQPSHIANLIISDHPYHPVRLRWLSAALIDFHAQLLPLVRYNGIRRVALLARPLILNHSQAHTNPTSSTATTFPLDWHIDILPLLTQQLQDLPKLRIDIHLPKNITI